MEENVREFILVKCSLIIVEKYVPGQFSSLQLGIKVP